MKSIIEYINEKLIVNKNTRAKKIEIEYNYFPKTKKELKDIIKELIEERGNEGDFNDIDTSEITDMSELFYGMQNFNGNILHWNVSNVTDMNSMFDGCKKFNCDLSEWDVSKVKDMHDMFMFCNSFNRPLNKWNVSNVVNMTGMFYDCRSFNQDISNWDVFNVEYKYMKGVFEECPIEEKYKPKFK